MKPSQFKISISVESYHEKTDENYQNSYIVEKGLFPNYQRYLSQIVIVQIEDSNEDCVKIQRPYLLYFPRYKPSKSVTVEPGRFS